MVGQQHPFGESGRARRILHVHFVMRIDLSTRLPQRPIVIVMSADQQFGRRIHAPLLFMADIDHIAQLRKTFGTHFSPFTDVEFGHQVVHNLHIIAVPIPIDHTHGMDVRIFQDIGDLGRFIIEHAI